ncbi:MAG TPA: leucine--tRNA ligase [Candidatus Saccharimonadia bacterium]|nr:leucine--tRNA ligase [Candidatus Saccharimonadia bacterium]
MKRYNPKEIEPKWQSQWQSDGIYKALDNSKKPKKYVLEFFPYPSGNAMHVGHVRNYTIGDTLARFNRMNGYNVLHPMGWDGFGLPAENYAIKTGISPRVAIDRNTKRFKQQLMAMGFGYDWSREVDSTDPKYYKWTQWFFLYLFKKGLAYRQESLQWWCPKDKTVLANEQVEAGRCWRCGHVVEKKALKQWFFKITDYADDLEKDLEDLDWSESIKTVQRNWIGKSIGCEADFKIKGQAKVIKVFTTRIDTIYGATFLVLAPEHYLLKEIVTKDQKAEVDRYIDLAMSKSDIQRQDSDKKKTGVFSGAYAINPIHDQPIPIWIADYVLGTYGSGAIMAVPGHDQRDMDFATEFSLPIIEVIEPVFGEPQGDEVHKDKIIAVLRDPRNNKVIVLDWGLRQKRHGGNMLIGGSVEKGEDTVAAAEREIREETGYSDIKFVRKLTSRGHGYFYSNVKNQNYCGHCSGLLFELGSDKKVSTNLDEGEKNKFNLKWMDEDSVDQILDDGIHQAFYKRLVLNECYTGEGIMIHSGDYDGISSSEMRDRVLSDLVKQKKAKEKVNYKIRDWLISRQRYWGAPIPIIYCTDDGIVAVPEDELPVLLPEIEKYEPSVDGRSPLANVDSFVNTICPKCGKPAKRETDTMDGFACSSWYFLRFADPHNDKQPFSKDKVDYWLPVDEYIGGAEHAVMHLLYARFWTKVMHSGGLINFSEPFKTLKNHGMILAPDGAKMSKSKNNTIEPETLLEQGYGADTIRIMELFIGPWDQSANWSVEGMAGANRFLQRIWTICSEFLESKTKPKNDETSETLKRVINQTIDKTSKDIHNLSFNTAIAAQMECLNQLYKLKEVDNFSNRESWSFALKTLLQLLAPFAPHISEELWSKFDQNESIHLSSWPAADEIYLKKDKQTIVIQVNGKLRSEIEISFDLSEAEITDLALKQSKVNNAIKGKNIKKTIHVKDRLVNFVT